MTDPLLDDGADGEIIHLAALCGREVEAGADGRLVYHRDTNNRQYLTSLQIARGWVRDAIRDRAKMVGYDFRETMMPGQSEPSWHVHRVGLDPVSRYTMWGRVGTGCIDARVNATDNNVEVTAEEAVAIANSWVRDAVLRKLDDPMHFALTVEQAGGEWSIYDAGTLILTHESPLDVVDMWLTTGYAPHGAQPPAVPVQTETETLTVKRQSDIGAVDRRISYTTALHRVRELSAGSNHKWWMGFRPRPEISMFVPRTNPSVRLSPTDAVRVAESWRSDHALGNYFVIIKPGESTTIDLAPWRDRRSPCERLGVYIPLQVQYYGIYDPVVIFVDVFCSAPYMLNTDPDNWPVRITRDGDSFTFSVPALTPSGTVARCPSCRQVIDPDTCHCGDLVSDHRSSFDGTGYTTPVPMGCLCAMREQSSRPRSALADLSAVINSRQLEIDLSRFAEAVSNAVGYWIPCPECSRSRETSHRAASCLEHGGRRRAAAVASAVWAFQYLRGGKRLFPLRADAPVPTTDAERVYDAVLVANRESDFPVGPATKSFDSHEDASVRFGLLEL